MYYRCNICLEFELGRLYGYNNGGSSDSAEQRQQVIRPCLGV